MALRMRASSTSNALRVSGAFRAHLLPAFSLSRCFSTGSSWRGVFVELLETGRSVSQGGCFGAVESVKATSDVNSPISGEIIDVNSKFTESLGLINSSSYEERWMIKVKPSSTSELEFLMSPKEYANFCEEEDAAH